jgi:hypothetical protein
LRIIQSLENHVIHSGKKCQKIDYEKNSISSVHADAVETDESQNDKKYEGYELFIEKALHFFAEKRVEIIDVGSEDQ